LERRNFFMEAEFAEIVYLPSRRRARTGVRGDGPVPTSGGVFADISRSCAASSISAPLCTRAFGKSGVRRCLCNGNARGADCRSESSGGWIVDTHRALSAVHEDLEFD